MIIRFRMCLEAIARAKESGKVTDCDLAKHGCDNAARASFAAKVFNNDEPWMSPKMYTPKRYTHEEAAALVNPADLRETTAAEQVEALVHGRMLCVTCDAYSDKVASSEVGLFGRVEEAQGGKCKKCGGAWTEAAATCEQWSPLFLYHEGKHVQMIGAKGEPLMVSIGGRFMRVETLLAEQVGQD